MEDSGNSNSAPVKESVFNPWEVKGDINYEKLLKDFGVQKLESSSLPKEFHKELLFRRNLVFAHRDFGYIITAIEHKKPFVMMTGLMPTGKFHIGHMILARQIIFYQSLGAKVVICVADIEAYNARGVSLEEGRKTAIDQYILNYIALGLKPENCEIYFQSDRSKDAEKSNAYYRLQNILARHATFNEFKAVYGEISPAKMVSALLQASDMLHMQLPEFEGSLPVLVPVGIDQDPHLRIARDMMSRVMAHNNIKFKELCSTYHTFVPGLSGGKMSSSDATSFVALTDEPEEAARKVKKYAFSGGRDTLDEHRRLGGNPDIDVSFQWLKIFEEDDALLEKIHNDYKSGALLSGELKNLLIEKLTAFLKDHQEKRRHAEKVLHKYIHVKD
ncbi:MAG TPA: tryptophan--tRNA ligase [Alphaproteobacteria bacterium]|nr:tryptophan--tRNA ligase [Alphaproteobacteria bacterium]